MSSKTSRTITLTCSVFAVLLYCADNAFAKSDCARQPKNASANKAVVRALQRTAKLPANKHGKVWISKSSKGSVGTSVVTGFHAIKGWERSVVSRDQNLNHWQWLAMQEADKAYLHYAPGTVGKHASQKHYLKPIHVPTPVAYHPAMPIVSDNLSGRYIKPSHIPLPERSLDTKAIVSVPSTFLSLKAPTTKGSVATTDTHVVLSAPHHCEQPTKVANDEMSAAGSTPQGTDSFQDPSQPASSVYAPRKHPVGFYGKSTTAANVHGKMLRRAKVY